MGPLRLSPPVRLLAWADAGTQHVHLHTPGDIVSPPTTTYPHVWYSRGFYNREELSLPPRYILPGYISISIQRSDPVPRYNLTSGDHPVEERIRESMRTLAGRSTWLFESNRHIGHNI